VISLKNLKIHNMKYLLVFLILTVAYTDNECKAQKRKCFYCNGTTKWKVYGNCSNCSNWNESYRQKVACTICKDERKAWQTVKCQLSRCKNGYCDISWFDCIEKCQARIDPHLFYGELTVGNKVIIGSEAGIISGEHKLLTMKYFANGRLEQYVVVDQISTYGNWKCSSSYCIDIQMDN